MVHQDRERRLQRLPATVTTELPPLIEPTEKLIKAVDEGRDIRHADAKEYATHSVLPRQPIYQSHKFGGED